MDLQFKLGLGLGFGMAIIFFFLQYQMKVMPPWIAWPGIAFGILLALWGISPLFPFLQDRVPTGPAFLFMVGFAIIVSSFILGLGAKQQLPKLPPAKQPTAEEIATEVIKKLPTETAKPTFFLASCTFDGKFEVIGNFEAFRRAYPESGSATIIMDIFPKDMPNEGINIMLSGYWKGTTGIMPIYPEDSVVFILSERMFVFYHKKPIIEYATNNMTHLYAGKEYVIQLTGFPGLVIPLFPKLLNIRSREGLIVTIQNFAPLKERPGWYYAIFKLG